MTGSPAAWAEATRLDAALRARHAGDDPVALSALHRRAALLMDSDAARRFHLTHAWVYALVAGDAGTIAQLEDQLRVLGGL